MTEDLLANIEITPRDVKALLARGEKFLLVDVREKSEYDTSRIEGATLIPMREIPANLSRLENAGEVVLLCHHGMRSLDVAAWLRSQGVAGARSMAGGIDRWALEVDPAVPRY
ncbi:MAG TPA: rhodanese-like domain-containing protein [Candidatus Limnocylindria bacterium]|nr:rhodanese-like domain-containing protein [Candidatus Limnocylindria bacterium]